MGFAIRFASFLSMNRPQFAASIATMIHQTRRDDTNQCNSPLRISKPRQEIDPRTRLIRLEDFGTDSIEKKKKNNDVMLESFSRNSVVNHIEYTHVAFSL